MKFKLFPLIALLCIAQGPVAAETWDWNVTPYLWAAGINGDVAVGPINADISMDFEDIFNVLRGGALMRVEARTDRHGISGDLVYLRLKEENAKDTVGGTLEVKMDSLIVEGAYYYRWNERFALELGMRYWDFETTLRPEVLPQVVSSSDWLDGFAGLRVEGAINEKWSWQFRGNVGAGGSDFTAGLDLDLRRGFASGNELTVGFRALDIDYGDSSRTVPIDLDVTFSGLTIGYAFNL